MLRAAIVTTPWYSEGTFKRSRFSADFGTLKQGPASVLFSRFLRPNNSAAAALQLAAPVLQQRTVSLQSHTKTEIGNRKTLKDIQQLDKSSPRTLRQEPALYHQRPIENTSENLRKTISSPDKNIDMEGVGGRGTTHHRSKFDLFIACSELPLDKAKAQLQQKHSTNRTSLFLGKTAGICVSSSLLDGKRSMEDKASNRKLSYTDHSIPSPKLPRKSRL